MNDTLHRTEVPHEKSPLPGTSAWVPGAPSLPGTPRKSRSASRQSVEWPTVALAMVIYGGFAALTWWYEFLPWWVVLPIGGYLTAWHGSLQHEVAHGHPTPWPLANHLLVLPSLWLWLPFRLYQESHLTHHHDEILTDPEADPESYYVSDTHWARAGTLYRSFLWARNTVAGRLVLEPIHCAARLYLAEGRRFLRGDVSHTAPWAWHGLGCAIILGWTMGICRIPFIEYLLLFVYPGLSLTLFRSFLEHQAHLEPGERTVIVEGNSLFSILYLNNNLHVLHHLRPGVPWYRLPRLYQNLRSDLIARNGGYLYRGYGEIFARYLFRPKEHPSYAIALSRP